jgi:acid ceramidase
MKYARSESLQAKEFQKDWKEIGPILVLTRTCIFQANIISRSREQAVNVLPLKEPNWFLLQTNYDNWVKPPFYDNRRDPGIKCMKQVALSSSSFRLGSL